MRRVLVSGGSGFLGRTLVAELLKNPEYEIHSLSRTGAKEISSRIHFHQGSILDAEMLLTLFDAVKPEWVFHLAADIRHDKDPRIEQEVYATNVQGTENILRAAQQVAVSVFVAAGSFEEYGPIPAPFLETDEPKPVTVYGRSKLEATQWVIEYSKRNLPSIVLRFPVLYGENQEGKSLVVQFLNSARTGAILKMSKGEQTRDFLHVSDAVSALLAAAQQIEKCNGQIINVCSGRPVSVADVVHIVESLVGHPVAVLGALPYREGEQMQYYGDNTKARMLVQWTPRVSLEAGLKKLLSKTS